VAFNKKYGETKSIESYINFFLDQKNMNEMAKWTDFADTIMGSPRITGIQRLIGKAEIGNLTISEQLRWFRLGGGSFFGPFFVVPALAAILTVSATYAMSAFAFVNFDARVNASLATFAILCYIFYRVIAPQYGDNGKFIGKTASIMSVLFAVCLMFIVANYWMPL
jgi:hypothetical protein